MKFIRRSDLTTQTRIEIALLAVFNQGLYGSITHLSQLYKISRTFVYQLLWAAHFALIQEFNTSVPSKDSAVVKEQLLDKSILLLRLEGSCSLESISNILTALGQRPCSVGYVSQRLKYFAQKLSNTLQTDSVKLVVFLSDELFANCQPILITIEPKSTAILRIELADDRTALSWKAHWQAIEHNQFYTVGLVSDRGKGLVQGFEQTFPGLPYYPDQFHDLRELAKAVLVDLEKAAYKAIAHEHERYSVLDSARSERVFNQRLQAYQQAVSATQQAISCYENYLYLFHNLQHNLDLFDPQGQLRRLHEDILAILDLMEQLAHPRVQEIVHTFKQRLDSFLLYFQKAKQIYQSLASAIQPPQALQALCLAWQYHHKLYQAKTAQHKHHCQQERDFYLDYAEALLGQRFQDLKQHTFTMLDTVVKASSLVEMINSLIRPYLNSCKGHITQDTLNLIMFYHNHRKFNDGKRKQQAPVEILTGKPLEEHWLDLLIAA